MMFFGVTHEAGFEYSFNLKLVLAIHVPVHQQEHQLDPLLRHHEQTLHQQSLHQLRSDALVEAQQTFVVHDVAHHFDEGFEFLLASRRGGLQADFCDDEGLRGEGCQCLREGAEDCSLLVRRFLVKPYDLNGGWIRTERLPRLEVLLAGEQALPAPLVIAGLTTSTKLAFSPLHRPVQPSAATTSFAVETRSFRSAFSDVCCRVVTTATGIVNSCASAPATAPNDSSATVDRLPAVAAAACIER
ncbi:hypothetical protein Dda_3647 [Drechslerella dactyloides]|uniref:Uncharacterized protein n=1 Tax=Drechslerella dactyloides TaxID=74499 RepID=A0AAD6J2T9_DREDA|nr:hypothetical protein Dda_3647 [Drechslerella dactyloides]